MQMNLKEKTFAEIVRMIRADWKNVNFAAKPYLEAMSAMTSPNDSFGFDSGVSIISYFLANAATWRGEVAKAVKAELKARISAK